MNRFRKIVAASALVLALGLGALAGPFVGGSIVPSESTARPYLTLGWDSGSWIMASLGLSNPLIANGWYWIEVSPLYELTSSWRIGGSVGAWLEMCSWQFTDSAWTVGVTGVGKWNGLLGQITLNVPMEIAPEAPLFGGWVVISVKYDFFPCCITPTPTCPDLGAGCQ